MLSIPSAICMVILADPLCALLYGGGKFTFQGVHASAYVLVLFSLGVIGLGVAQVINRAFYSLHDTITPTIVSVGMVLCNFLLSWLLASFHPLQIWQRRTRHDHHLNGQHAGADGIAAAATQRHRRADDARINHQIASSLRC